MFPVNRKPNRNLVSKRFGEANEFVGDLFDSLGDFFVVDALAVESMGCGKREPWNNNATKIEHETVCVRHHRHITRVASGRAKEADDLVFPYASRELDHVLGCRGDIVIVNRRGDEDTVGAFNGRAQSF